MIDLASTAFDNVCAHLRQTALLSSVEELLGWDERTLLPPLAGEYRAEQITFLSGLVHQRRTDPRLGEWLADLAASPLAEDPHSDAGTIIRRAKRDFEKHAKTPQSLVEALTRASVLGQQAWVKARQENDFPALAPLLTQIVDLKREQAEALGYEDCRYDALLDDFEPDAKTASVRTVLEGLRKELAPFVAEIADSNRTPPIEILERSFPVAAQEAFGKRMAEAIGFDFNRGRLDVTHHPFCSSMGPHDCRITTRYNEHHFPGAFFGILHEAGHGLYDQGLRTEQFGLPLGSYVSLGIHESQSRMWENLVGRSMPFWRFAWPQAQQAFPSALGKASFDDFFFAVNDVRPTLIRVEADEATYNLHIILRFELEQALIDKELAVADLPGAWKE